MRIEKVTLSNFRCFGPDPVTIDLSSDITAFIGANGSGKTAVLQALSRLFGVTSEPRRVRLQDFHVPSDEIIPPESRTLAIEVILDFPELRSPVHGNDQHPAAIPEFFHQMTIDDGGNSKCRLRLDAQWTDDGSIEGAIDESFRAVRTLAVNFEDEDCSNVSRADRTRVQMVYVPSARDGASQVAAFLRGRLWRAVSWTDEFRQSASETGGQINSEFRQQLAVETVESVLRERWRGVVGREIRESPTFRAVDQRFEELVRRVEVLFTPPEASRPLPLGELGDGQRSLFHIALTLATIEVEAMVRSGTASGFIKEQVHLPSLTLIALEEPENNLAPFYISRIVREMRNLIESSEHAQGLISSHSASLLGRVPPEDVRHFRLHQETRVSEVRGITLPPEPEAAAKFVRQAVRSYPELYFAKFVILGEGASEQVAIHRIAEAHRIHIDQSFVAVVPLGGRHVNHFWKLLRDLDIPYVTLLDLDAGRSGGGWGRVKYVCCQLLTLGVGQEELFDTTSEDWNLEDELNSFDEETLDESIFEWTHCLRKFGVFFSGPLDLDMLLLDSFLEDYQNLQDGQTGPRFGNGVAEHAETAVLGAKVASALYGDEYKALFSWYRYLFLGRGKPGTHFRVLGEMSDADIIEGTPDVLLSLLHQVRAALGLDSVVDSTDA